ncbi:MAG: hypothetical protein ACT4P5_02125 [Armatimonadota bacterium]
MKAALDKIKGRWTSSESPMKILKELYKNDPEKLAKALKDLEKLKEHLQKIGLDPADFFNPSP